VAAAIIQYRRDQLLTRNRNQGKSADVAEYRLRRFFRPVLSTRLSALTPERCRRLYLGAGDELGSVTRPTRFGKPPAVASHQAELFGAQSMLTWCVQEEMLRKNPAADVEPVGEPESGKAQLGEDESNEWLDKAGEFALAGDQGAVAALVCFLVALRASEITGLTRRQIDSDFTVIWVIRGKTKRAKRRLKIPVDMDMGRILRTCLRSLCEGKGHADLVFGQRDRSWIRLNVRRICRAAGVPLVSAHGLRGTHATLAEEEGSTPANMLRSLGHESRGVQHRSYIEPGATERGTQKRFAARMKVVRGGQDEGPIQWRKRGVKVGQ
jgi:integrase